MKSQVYVVDNIPLPEAIRRYTGLEAGSYLQVFFTGSIDDVCDYSLLNRPPYFIGINNPFYVGNCDDIEHAKKEFLRYSYPGFEVKKLP